MSPLEELFLERWENYYPEYPLDRELKLIPNRAYRFDFAYPDAKIAVEINGGNYSDQRQGHSSSQGLRRDYEKYNLAQLYGYSLFVLDTRMIEQQDWYHLIADKLKQNLALQD